MLHPTWYDVALESSSAGMGKVYVFHCWDEPFVVNHVITDLVHTGAKMGFDGVVHE